jgi:hypothetical protein
MDTHGVVLDGHVARVVTGLEKVIMDLGGSSEPPPAEREEERDGITPVL